VFEYHGWATLREAEEIDCPINDPARAGDCLRTTTLNSIGSLLESDGLRNVWQRAELSSANGAWHLHLSGYRNHRQALVLETWGRIGELAPGSYGLLYVQDDEDPERNNEWVAGGPLRGGTAAPAGAFQ